MYGELVAPTAALIDAATGRRWSGADLAAAVGRVCRGYDLLPVGMIFARTGRTVASVLRYLAAVAAGRPVTLLDPQLSPESVRDLIERFRPAAVVGLDEAPSPAAADCPRGYQPEQANGAGGIWRRCGTDTAMVHPDLALLLPTSGSTGNPKLVRLSRVAVLANAVAIAEALGIDRHEIAPTSLPLFYSYGLSVLNSHLVAGATVLVVGDTLLHRGFWRACEQHRATSLAGVPQHYELLSRLRWRARANPTLRTLTQAGGPLRIELVERFHQDLAEVGGRLFIMYGQTEATARISVLPPGRLADKPGSVGLPVPGGALTIDASGLGGALADPAGTGTTGEVVFSGPNVMLGYAEQAVDLARGDGLAGRLRTGDLGYLDREGYLFLAGRVGRLAKVFGVRVDLDHVERVAGAEGGSSAAVAGEDRVVVWCTQGYSGAPPEVAHRLADALRVHRSGFDVRRVDVLPTLPSGKVDYAQLAATVSAEEGGGGD